MLQQNMIPIKIIANLFLTQLIGYDITLMKNLEKCIQFVSIKTLYVNETK